jgi:hypothetical protein
MQIAPTVICFICRFPAANGSKRAHQMPVSIIIIPDDDPVNINLQEKK